MFKVGDRVRVKGDAAKLGDPATRPGWVNDMDATSGREGVVASIGAESTDGWVFVKVDGEHWYYAPEQLEQLEPATPATPATPPQAAMTLRDQFAMAAMHNVRVSMQSYAALAAACYDFADAMLAARDRKAGAQ